MLTSIVTKQADIPQSLKNLTLRDAVTFLKSAWDRLEVGTIAKCWSNILASSNDPEDDIPLSVLKEKWASEINAETEQTIELLHIMYPQVRF